MELHTQNFGRKFYIGKTQLIFLVRLLNRQHLRAHLWFRGRKSFESPALCYEKTLNLIASGVLFIQ